MGFTKILIFNENTFYPYILSGCYVCSLSDCRLRQVGLPVFQKYTYTYWGAWMKDPLPDPAIGDKYWLTKHFYGKLLFRYDSLDKFRNNESGNVLELQDFYFGTGSDYCLVNV